jgi:hypothetical protein
MSRGPIPDKPRDRPTVPQVLEQVKAYVEREGKAPGGPAYWNGGNLHIVLADQNESDESIEWCRERATEGGDEDGIALADLLLSLTRTQRRKCCTTIFP